MSSAILQSICFSMEWNSEEWHMMTSRNGNVFRVTGPFAGTLTFHYNDVIKSAMASQITGISIVCSIVGSVADQRTHQSSASLAFVQGIHRWPVNSPQKRPVMRFSIWWRHHVTDGCPLGRVVWIYTCICMFVDHYRYAIWARWSLKSPVSALLAQPFVQAQIKENIRAPRRWPLGQEFTDDR